MISKISLKLKKIDKKRELPFLSFYINLKFAQVDKKSGLSVDTYFNIFKMGLDRKYYERMNFWNMLLQFCILDRVIANETVAKWLP